MTSGFQAQQEKDNMYQKAKFVCNNDKLSCPTVLQVVCELLQYCNFVKTYELDAERNLLLMLNSSSHLQVLWDKETIFSGAEHTEIDYEICSLDGGSRPEPVVENIYRKVILNVSDI